MSQQLQSPQQFAGGLLTAEMSEKQARSIKYQITIAKLPLATDIDDFIFDDAPVNETLVRNLAGGEVRLMPIPAIPCGGSLRMLRPSNDPMPPSQRRSRGMRLKTVCGRTSSRS